MSLDVQVRAILLGHCPTPSLPTGISLDLTTLDPAPTTLAINHALPLQIEGDQQREVILF